MRDATEPTAELALFGPPGPPIWFAEMPTPTHSTSKARSEELSQKATDQDPRLYGKRGTSGPYLSKVSAGRREGTLLWRFWRADGKPWDLVGPGAARTGVASGDSHVSRIILTSNADAHPLLSGMHKPDSKLGPNRRGKRSAITVSREEVYRWLYRTITGPCIYCASSPPNTSAPRPASDGGQGDSLRNRLRLSSGLPFNE